VFLLKDLVPLGMFTCQRIITAGKLNEVKLVGGCQTILLCLMLRTVESLKAFLHCCHMVSETSLKLLINICFI
jgi:hypothetical protein